MVNAFRAGTIVAVLAGAIGWFMVLRRQSFAGHTLAVVSFPGAAGRDLARRERDVGLLRRVHRRRARHRNGAPPGVRPRTQRRVRGHRHRPSVRVGLRRAVRQPLRRIPQQPHRPAVRHVPRDLRPPGRHLVGRRGGRAGGARRDRAAAVLRHRRPRRRRRRAACPSDCSRSCSSSCSGCAAAEVSQITGALLVFALLVMPAASAQQLTARPALSFALTIALAHRSSPGSGSASPYFSVYPVGFFVTTFGIAVFVLSRRRPNVAARLQRRAPRGEVALA